MTGSIRSYERFQKTPSSISEKSTGCKKFDKNSTEQKTAKGWISRKEKSRPEKKEKGKRDVGSVERISLQGSKTEPKVGFGWVLLGFRKVPGILDSRAERLDLNLRTGREVFVFGIRRFITFLGHLLEFMWPC